MSLTKCRFIFDNIIKNADMISTSSVATGLVTNALKEGTGSAIITPSGAFIGTQDKEITIEIDSIAGGQSVGQSTFKWTDGRGEWVETGRVTASTATHIGDEGLYVLWTAGSGNDFELGDKWYVKLINLYSPVKMIDYDRDAYYKSGSLDSPNTITISSEYFIDGAANYLDGASGMVVSGDYAYIASYESDALVVIDGYQFLKPKKITTSGTNAFVTLEDADCMIVLDISDPTAPFMTNKIVD